MNVSWEREEINEDVLSVADEDPEAEAERVRKGDGFSIKVQDLSKSY